MEGIAQLDAQAQSRSDAFTASVAHQYPALARRLTAVVGDPEVGLDLAQETYLRAYRAWDRFDGTDVRAWIYTIGLRLAINERTRRIRWNRLIGAREVDPAWVHPDDRGLHDALRRLRPEHRAALLLCLVDGYTYAEASAILDVASGTIASWVSRAKAELRKELADD